MLSFSRQSPSRCSPLEPCSHLSGWYAGRRCQTGDLLDLIGILFVCVLVVVAGDTAQQAFLDVAIVIALISFVGTVAYAQLSRARRQP